MQRGRLYALKTQAGKLHSMLESFEDSAKDRIEQLQKGVNDGVRVTKRAAHSMDRFSRKKPWKAIGLFSAASLIVGFIYGSRRR